MYNQHSRIFAKLYATLLNIKILKFFVSRWTFNRRKIRRGKHNAMKITKSVQYASIRTFHQKFLNYKNPFRPFPGAFARRPYIPVKNIRPPYSRSETGDEDYICVSRTFEFKTEGVRLRDERANRF